MIDLGDSSPLEPVVPRPWLSDPVEALALHELRMDQRVERVRALKAFAARNGIDDIGADDGQRLQDWFVEVFVVDRSAEHPSLHEPDLFWSGFCLDVGLWLGEEAIARTNAKLRWDYFCDDQNTVGFHESVLVGFGDHFPNKDYFDTPLNVPFGTGSSISRGRRFKADGWARKLRAMVAVADPTWRPGRPGPDIVSGKVDKP